jgi:hypothetical protein
MVRPSLSRLSGAHSTNFAAATVSTSWASSLLANFAASFSQSSLPRRIDHDLNLCEFAHAELLVRVQLAHSDDIYRIQPPSIPGFQELDLGRYILLDTPLADEYFLGTLHHTHSSALEFLIHLVPVLSLMPTCGQLLKRRFALTVAATSSSAN